MRRHLLNCPAGQDKRRCYRVDDMVGFIDGFRNLRARDAMHAVLFTGVLQDTGIHIELQLRQLEDSRCSEPFIFRIIMTLTQLLTCNNHSTPSRLYSHRLTAWDRASHCPCTPYKFLYSQPDPPALLVPTLRCKLASDCRYRSLHLANPGSKADG